MASADTLLQIESLTKHFPIFGGIIYRQIATVHAVEDVSLKVRAGETLGLVGESGCGKSTLGRTLLHLYPPSSGKVIFDGEDLGQVGHRRLRALRAKMQMIFQDPYESLNPRHTVGQILEEPFIIHGQKDAAVRRDRVRQLLDRVGLAANAVDRFPHEFSGGQRQRIGIARAISQHPRLVVCDEAVSALDVSIQSQVLNLLVELQRELGLTYIFIAHDLAVVKHISDRIAVMYLGRVVELAEADALYASPLHPYTSFLIQAIPIPDPTRERNRKVLVGDIPSPIKPPQGCKFHTRCPYAQAECREREPELKEYRPGHWARCHLVGKISL
jgi:oligopeptide/dipeptide ABC transporter ATP-binding protein